MNENKRIYERIRISSHMKGDGILGPPYEYGLYTMVWTDFDPCRIEKKFNYIEYGSSDENEIHVVDSRRIQAVKDYNSFYSQHTHKKAPFERRNVRRGGGGDGGANGFHDSYDLNDDSEGTERQEPHINIKNHKIGLYRSDAEVIVPNIYNYDEMRGDLTIWFKLNSNTTCSGVDALDKTDSPYAIRQIPDGITTLELYSLFKQHIEECHGNPTKTSFIVKSAYIDPKVTGIFLRDQKEMMVKKGMKLNNYDESKMVETALTATYKALVNFEVTIEGFNMENYKKSILSISNLKEDHLNAMPASYSSSSSLSAHGGGGKKSSSSSSSRDNSLLYIQKKRATGKGGTFKPCCASFMPQLFNSKKSVNAMMSHLDSLVKVYCNSFITLDDRKSDYQPLNKNVANLQLPLFISEQGPIPLPASAYWTNHCPYTREYPNLEERKKALAYYGYDESTEKYFKMIFNSSLRRHGLSKKVFIDTVDAQFSIENKDKVRGHLYDRCVQAVIDVGTFAANSAYYTADYRYIPLYDVSTNSYLKTNVVRRGMDSFDSEILNLGSNSDDCEGQSNVATTIIRAFSFGRHDYLTLNKGKKADGTLLYNEINEKAKMNNELEQGVWKSRLLQRVQLMLKNNQIVSVGSTVTSAYVDTDNKTIINMKDRDLPIINDKIDRNSRCDGHCFALFIPLNTFKTMLINGKNDADVIETFKPYYITKERGVGGGSGISSFMVKQYDQFLPRDVGHTMNVVEGTGSIDPTVRPINEVYKMNDIERRRVTTEKLFLKSLKGRLLEIDKGEKESKARDAMMALFQCEGMQSYIEERPLDQRISPFYREVVQAITDQAYIEHDVTLSQAAFCKVRGGGGLEWNDSSGSGEMRYGVNMGELLRAPLSNNANGIALISPYRNSKKEWIESIIPMMECIQNKMPIMAFGRYSKEQYENEIFSYYIDPASLPLNDYKFPSTMDEIRKYKTEDSSPASLADFHNVCENKDLTIIRLYSRTWKLNKSKEQMIKFLKFIEDSPGLKRYAFFVEKHLPNCDPIVEILSIIDIKRFESQSPLNLSNK